MPMPARATLAALACSATACADFIGIAVNESKVGETCVVDVYATFSEVDVLLNIFDVDMTIEGGFGSLIHSDFIGGSWAPQFSSNPATDSFVVIGGEANFSNSTSADPNWGIGFSSLAIPSGAGWFNSNPPNLQGQSQFVNLFDKQGQGTWTGFATRIMRIVFVNPAADGKDLTITGAYTNNQGLGTPAEQGDFAFSAALCAVPAPGAVALFGLVGLADIRRRRRPRA